MTQEERERGGLARAVRAIVMWLVVVLVAAGIGFGIGYVLRDKDAKELGQRLAQQETELTAKITALEKQVLEAEKSQLERALARAKLKAGLDEVLESLTEAQAEVDQRNFGRALQKIEAAKGAIAAAPGTPEAVRKAVLAALAQIKGDLERFDVKAREKIKALAEDLEKGEVSAKASQ